MKVQIRRGVFETNSSSSHSLSMNPEAVRDMALAEASLRSGTMKVVIDDHFGWEWRRLYTPENKIAYLLSQVCPEQLARFTSIEDLRYESDRADFIIGTIERETGIKIEVNVTTSYPGVDHESQGLTRDLHYDPKDLMDFVFSSKCYIETGNDNEQPPSMIDTDLGRREESWPDHFQDKKPNGLKVSLTAQQYGNEAEFLVDGDEEPLKGEASFCSAGNLKGFVKDLIISDIHITLFKPRKFNSLRLVDGVLSDGSEKWESVEHRVDMAWDGIHHLINAMSEDDGDIRVLRDLNIDIEIEAAPEDRYVHPFPRICMTGVMPEENIQNVKDGFANMTKCKAAYDQQTREYEERRAENAEDPGF